MQSNVVLFSGAGVLGRGLSPIKQQLRDRLERLLLLEAEGDPQEFL